MIHAHDIQRALLHGPRTRPVRDGARELAPIPVLIEIRIRGLIETVPCSVVRVSEGAYRLTADLAGPRENLLLEMALSLWKGREAELVNFVHAMAERVAGQSEILAGRAEKTLKVKEGSGY